MKVYYISDLHLEFLNSSKIEKIIHKMGKHSDDILILAGDIGNPFSSTYKTFLQTISTMFEKVFIILGNHEYYGNYIFATEQYFKKVCKECNVVGLINESVLYNGYKIIGSTLWSNVTGRSSINDTEKIIGMTKNIYNKMHQECVNYIMSELDPTYKMILILHHLPSYSLIDPKYKKGVYVELNEWFATNIIEKIPIEIHQHLCAIVYGHTHTERITMVENIQTYCNPIGYPGERRNINYQTYFDA